MSPNQRGSVATRQARNQFSLFRPSFDLVIPHSTPTGAMQGSRKFNEKGRMWFALHTAGRWSIENRESLAAAGSEPALCVCLLLAGQWLFSPEATLVSPLACRLCVLVLFPIPVAAQKRFCVLLGHAGATVAGTGAYID